MVLLLFDLILINNLLQLIGWLINGLKYKLLTTIRNLLLVYLQTNIGSNYIDYIQIAHQLVVLETGDHSQRVVETDQVTEIVVSFDLVDPFGHLQDEVVVVVQVANYAQEYLQGLDKCVYFYDQVDQIIILNSYLGHIL
jgi:hypothetical protein